MATLFNTKISATYEGLLKTIDNAAISATLKELTDGSGNQSGLYLNTAGDFKVTSVLEWGSLKDTGTGVTITRYVTSTDGLENFDNNTSLPTSAAVKLYVDTKFATSDTLQEVLSFGNTTSGNDIVVSLNDDITFTDSSKALFGNGQDLEINHNGTDSFVTDLGTGDLRLRSDNSIKIQASTGGNNLATFTKGAGVDLYFNNAKKLETTNTGISVTGIISNLTNPIAAQDAATKSYVDALDAGSDLDITDGTTTGDVNLNTQTLSILGTTNEIETVVSGQSVTIGLPSSISTDLVGNVTGNLTGDVTGDVSGNVTGNVTGDLAGNVVGNVTGNVAGDLTGNVTSTSVLANGVTATTQASTDSSTKVATTAYVKGLDNASDLDFSGDSGTGDVNLNAQTFAITGTANQIESSASNQGLSLQFPTAGVTLPNGSVATTQSADDNSTKVATTSYVDTSAALYLPLAGGTMSGNTIHNDSIKSIYGTGSDAQVYHDGSNFYANNSTGQLNIDQSAVTESIVFKTSDANALDTTALIINRGGDLITGRDVTIAGDLTVNGTTTTVNSQTLSVDDPLISLAINNAANSLDIGYYGKYNDGTTRYLGLYNDASDSNKFKLFKGTTVEPTTTVNIGAAGYAAADLELANLISTGTISGVLANGVTATTQTAGDNSTKVATTAYANAAASAIPIGDYLPLVGGTLTGDLTISKAGTPLFQLVDTTNNVSLLFGADNSNTFLRSSSGSMFFQTNGGTSALTLDSSQNATFAETITVQGTGDSSFVGNVGIGTDSPNAQLDIFNGTTGASLKLSATATAYWQLQRDSITGNLNISDDALGNVMSFDQLTGNVGIGTDTPDAKLHIQGTASSNGGIRLHNSGGNPYSIWSDNNDLFISKGDGVSTAISVKYGGNVGIGTDSPRAKLDISTPDPSTNFEVLDFRNPSDFGIFATSSSVSGKGNTLDFKSSDYNSGAGIQTRNLLSLQPSGNVGIGTDSPNAKLEIFGTGNSLRLDSAANQSKEILLRNVGTGIASIKTDGDLKLDAEDAGKNILFNTAGSERMRIASDGQVFMTKASASHNLVLTNNTAGGDFIKCVGETGDTVFSLDSDGTGGEAALRMYKDGVLKNYIAASGNSYFNGGNVGIGTDSPSGKLQVTLPAYTNEDTSSQQAIFGVDSGYGVRVGYNETDNKGYINVLKPAVAWGDLVLQSGGGNVGIGTDNPSAKLEVRGDAPTYTNASTVFWGGTTNNDSHNGIMLSSFGDALGGSIGSNINYANSGTPTQTNANRSSGQIQFGNTTSNSQTSSIAFGGYYKGSTAFTERMRIASDGNVTIKAPTASGGGVLNLENTTNAVNGSVWGSLNFISNDTSSSASGIRGSIVGDSTAYSGECDLVFSTAPSNGTATPRMRITSGGDVLIGTTGTPNGTSVYGSAFTSTASSIKQLNQASSTTSAVALQKFFNPNGKVGQIVTSGSTTTYEISSDYRLKEDLQDFNGLDMISNIPVYDYKWKVDESRSYGVMAHELQEVLPNAVSGEKDAEEMQGVDYSKIVPLLIKSIQELTAKVERLEAK